MAKHMPCLHLWVSTVTDDPYNECYHGLGKQLLQLYAIIQERGQKQWWVQPKMIFNEMTTASKFNFLFTLLTKQQQQKNHENIQWVPVICTIGVLFSRVYSIPLKTAHCTEDRALSRTNTGLLYLFQKRQSKKQSS